MKVKYIGHMRTCSVNINGTIVKHWGRGEVKDLAKHLAEKLLKDNVDFVEAEEVEEKKKKLVEKPEEELDLDINRDGKVDDSDFSMAAKVLRSKKKDK